MFCEKCGKEMSTLMVDVFNHDGSDEYYTHCVEEHEENAVTIDTTPNWTGFELSDEERVNTIKCPYCRQFPFESTEIQIEELIRIVCFKSDKEKGMPKFIKDWNDLVGLESETHRLEIDTEMGCGWILPKNENADINASEYFKDRAYLSTHTFYGKFHKHSEKVLRKFGFDLEINNWDKEP